MNAVTQLHTPTELERIKSALVSFEEYTEIHSVENNALFMGLKALEYYLEGGSELTRKELNDIRQNALHEAKVEHRFAKQCCDISGEGANLTAVECAADILEAIEAMEII